MHAHVSLALPLANKTLGYMIQIRCNLIASYITHLSVYQQPLIASPDESWFCGS